MHLQRTSAIFCSILLLFNCSQKPQDYKKVKPVIDGTWWQVAGNPDLGNLTSKEQQPVDFGIWQAVDGTWQIWSCIRKTRETGKTRLFHHWEGQKLLHRNWEPKGIAMRADTTLGEHPGGMQAPYVIKNKGKYLMFYGDWNRICLAISVDGKKFQRVLHHGSPALFGDPEEINTRDAMVLSRNNKWYCYYTAHPNMDGRVYVRTSENLGDWSKSKVVSYGGQAGKGKLWLAECPHVVEHAPGKYYLFRTQSYGSSNYPAKTSVYFSEDLLNFGIDDDSGFVGTMEVAAPQIFQFENQWYIAALMPELNGIRIARLTWEEIK